jgi:hypothetical protein
VENEAYSKWISLIDGLNAEVTSSPTIFAFLKPKKDDLCLAVSSFDKKWHRCKVTRLLTDSLVELFFYDLGYVRANPSLTFTNS